MFRWWLIAVFVVTLGISAYFRRKARRSGETIARVREGSLMVGLRLGVTLPLLASLLAYMIHPPWMDWAAVAAPGWVRYVGAGLGLCVPPLAFWVFRTIGANISETVLTKESHALVTTGPYRWVRHPLYTTGVLLLVAASLLAANWFIGGFAVLVLVLVRWVVVPKEEAHLVAKFGDAYRSYRRDTGCLLPRLWSIQQNG